MRLGYRGREDRRRWLVGAQAPVAGGNSVCVKGIGYQHDSSQVSLTTWHISAPQSFDFPPLYASSFGKESLHTLRSMYGVSFLSEGSRHMSELLGILGELCLLTCFIISVIIWCLFTYFQRFPTFQCCWLSGPLCVFPSQSPNNHTSQGPSVGKEYQKLRALIKCANCSWYVLASQIVGRGCQLVPGRLAPE